MPSGVLSLIARVYVTLFCNPINAYFALTGSPAHTIRIILYYCLAKLSFMIILRRVLCVSNPNIPFWIALSHMVSALYWKQCIRLYHLHRDDTAQWYIHVEVCSTFINFVLDIDVTSCICREYHNVDITGKFPWELLKVQCCLTCCYWHKYITGIRMFQGLTSKNSWLIEWYVVWHILKETSAWKRNACAYSSLCFKALRPEKCGFHVAKHSSEMKSCTLIQIWHLIKSLICS